MIFSKYSCIIKNLKKEIYSYVKLYFKDILLDIYIHNEQAER